MTLPAAPRVGDWATLVENLRGGDGGESLGSLSRDQSLLRAQSEREGLLGPLLSLVLQTPKP